MKYGIGLPSIGMMLDGIKDAVEAYEMMTRVAQTADACGFPSRSELNLERTIPMEKDGAFPNDFPTDE